MVQLAVSPIEIVSRKLPEEVTELLSIPDSKPSHTVVGTTVTFRDALLVPTIVEDSTKAQVLAKPSQTVLLLPTDGVGATIVPALHTIFSL